MRLGATFLFRSMFVVKFTFVGSSRTITARPTLILWTRDANHRSNVFRTELLALPEFGPDSPNHAWAVEWLGPPTSSTSKARGNIVQVSCSPQPGLQPERSSLPNHHAGIQLRFDELGTTSRSTAQPFIAAQV